MNDRVKRVLVVDDDEIILETVKVALQKRGFDVLLARDGSEGLMRAERDSPDLILLDVVMPRRSGFSVLEHLHKNRIQSPPIIMMSANEEDRIRLFAESRGVEAFFQKPFHIDDLMRKIESLLGETD